MINGAETVELPATLHARKRVTARAQVPSLLHVRDDWPEQADFIALIDDYKARRNLRFDSSLAEAAGINQTALTNWRKGKVKPSLVSVTRIAEALGISPSHLAAVAGIITADFAAPQEQEPLPASIQRLAERYRDADEHQRMELERQINVTLTWFDATIGWQDRGRKAG